MRRFRKRTLRRSAGDPAAADKWIRISSVLLLTGLLAAGGLNSRAEARQTAAGSDFLNIAPFPTQLAVSEAVTAEDAGAASLYSNPSLLSLSRQATVDIAYTFWVSGITGQFAGLHYPLGEDHLALAIYHAGSDELLQPGGSLPLSVGYLSVAAGWSRELGPLRAGAALHYLREELLEVRAGGFALSGGLSASLFTERLQAGLSLLNAGRMQEMNREENPLPSVLRAGLSWAPPAIETIRFEGMPVTFRLTGDVVLPLNESRTRDFTLNDSDGRHLLLGLAVSMGEVLEFRGGLRSGSTERRSALGVSLLLEPISVHYSLIPFSTGYNNAHSIGIRYHFMAGRGG